MSTGITGSHRRSGDPSGGGTLTQRQASFLTSQTEEAKWQSQYQVSQPSR
jgi:hypothetical protein